jgi:hypothetical protein
MSKENKYTQLCVWAGTDLGDSKPEEMVKFFKDEMNTRIKYHKEVLTRPDLDDDGNPVPDTGGRIDQFFYVHSDDVGHFAVPRLQMGIRWWEDVVGYNDNRHLYTEEFLAEHELTW